MLGLSCLERSVNAVDRQNNAMINVLSVLILKEGGQYTTTVSCWSNLRRFRFQ